MSATSPVESIGTKICAASPSSEGIGGETPSCTPSTPAMSSASVCDVGELVVAELRRRP